jgi:drug/metabolite transporter (DMT)-like permease
VVAVLVGYFLGGEALGVRTILGTLFVLISVVVITMRRDKKVVASVSVEDAAEAVGS